MVTDIYAPTTAVATQIMLANLPDEARIRVNVELRPHRDYSARNYTLRWLTSRQLGDGPPETVVSRHDTSTSMEIEASARFVRALLNDSAVVGVGPADTTLELNAEDGQRIERRSLDGIYGH